MEPHRRDMIVARVASGLVRLRVLNEFNKLITVLIRHPSREDRYVAQEVYHQCLEEARLEGSYSQEEVLELLLKEKMWNDESESLMKRYSRDIEDFKVALVGMVFRQFEKKKTKLLLAEAMDKHAELYGRRHCYDHITAESAAWMAKFRYMVGSCLVYQNGQPVIPTESLTDHAVTGGCSLVFENAMEMLIADRIADEEMREVARTDPWNAIWATRGSSQSVFGVPAVDLTDEQLRLLSWSQMYENIVGHPEAPPKEVVEDDDACDGWIIMQSRKQKIKDNEAAADQVVTNERIKESEEVFIMADDHEAAKRIDELNDEGARRAKRQREEVVRKRGEVNQVDLPDVRAYCQMEATRLGADALKARTQ